MSGVSDSTVMILGSDAQFIYLMRYYSERSGHQVIVAPIGDEAMALAEQKRPTLIVLEADLMLSVSRNVLRALKTGRETCDIPVVVCSWQDENTNVLAQEADSYLQKPVSYEEFLVALEKTTPLWRMAQKPG